MVFILLIITFLFSLSLGKILFKRWFNHLSVYSLIWFVLLFMYELKLLRYDNLSSETWFVIILSYIAFHLGVVCYFALKRVNEKIETSNEELSSNPLFYKEGRLLIIVILITGFIGLAGGLQQWSVLIHKFGSIQKVILNANDIYRMRVEGEIQGIAYLPAFGFVSLFFAALYSAYKRKIAFISILPFTAIILKDLANIARALMLFGLVEYSIVFIVSIYVFNLEKSSSNTSQKSYLFRFLIIIVIFIGSASFVRSIKGSVEHYKSASSSIRSLNLFDVITPSIYLYLSADVGVLNKYLEHNNENTRFGENTFMPVYNILAKFDFVSKPDTYQKGYYIPMWTNTGTYIRELHADFGILGVVLGPFLLSFLATMFWFKFFNTRNIINLIFYTFISIIIFFSFLVMITRLGNWIIAFTLTILSFLVLQKIGDNMSRNREVS